MSSEGLSPFAVHSTNQARGNSLRFEDDHADTAPYWLMLLGLAGVAAAAYWIYSI